MKTDEFQRLTVQHGGLTGVSVVDPHVETETPSDDPNAPPIKSRQPNPTPKYKYVFADGTEMTALTATDGTIQVTDAGTALKPPANTAATQAETERHNRAVEAETAKRNAQAAAAATTTGSLANRRENRLITAEEAKAAQDKINADRQANIAERGMSVTEANAKAKAQMDELDAEIKRAENQRAADKAKADAEKAAFEREKYNQEQVSAREKEETRQREAQRKFAYDAGQDAVANAQKLLPYQVGPTFGSEFSTALNTLGKGGGPINFTPSGVTFAAPDYDAIAQQAAQRASALYSVPVASAAPTAPAPTAGVASAPVASPGMPAAAPVAAATANPALTAALQTVPVAPPPTPPPTPPPYLQPGQPAYPGQY